METLTWVPSLTIQNDRFWGGNYFSSLLLKLKESRKTFRDHLERPFKFFKCPFKETFIWGSLLKPSQPIGSEGENYFSSLLLKLKESRKVFQGDHESVTLKGLLNFLKCPSDKTSIWGFLLKPSQPIGSDSGNYFSSLLLKLKESQKAFRVTAKRCYASSPMDHASHDLNWRPQCPIQPKVRWSKSRTRLILLFEDFSNQTKVNECQSKKHTPEWMTIIHDERGDQYLF
jgi:hypothetical protein